MKRLTSMMLCSTLLLGLISNNRILNSYAEEDQAIIASQSDKEAKMTENQVEQENNPTTETTNDEKPTTESNSSELAKDSEEITNSDLPKTENESTDKLPSFSKKKAAKAVLAATQDEATTEDGQALDVTHTKFELSPDHKSITLTEYTGDKTDLVIPSKIKYKGMDLAVNVKINKGTNGGAKHLFPNTVRSIKFVSVGGTKVGLLSDTDYSLDYLFSIIGNQYDALTSIDFSGLDMDKVTSMYATFYGQFVPNLQTINFGDNTLPNVTNMKNAFNQLSKLESIQQHWTFGSLENMNQMFGMRTGQTKLTTIGDTSTWNTSTVTDMSQVFLNCSLLQSLDLSKWDTSNVTNMSQLFFNCKSLTTIGDTKNLNVSSVLNFTNMFYNCISLHQIRMDNWHVNQAANLGGSNNSMFYLWDITELFPALIVASDERLLNISYSAAGYKPSCEIRINANTGQLAKNEYKYYDITDTGISYYFDKVVIPTKTYTELEKSSESQLQENIRKWLEENIPTKTDYALTGWAPTDQDFEKTIQSINSFDDFINSKAEFKAEWVSDKFNTSADNTKLNPNGSLGLAYYPTAFTINSADLQSSGEQKIPISKKMSLNLGVKDRTRTTDKWHVTAQLTWIGNQLPNAYITAINTGTVTQNISTGLSGYSPETDLTSLTESGITGTTNYQINSYASSIMKSNGTMINNGVYDFNLGEAVLVIPDVSQVAAGHYQGQVNWNLTISPS
ncbi:BspA family leucine-rich repeat surface protein [Enterococcus casseliflavus]|uniref:BspA family leucine-rich repeat surface protein n=1 Tax=Enterococcus casseliflavus TaxID=37734 RepID=UPI002DB6E1C6|nr:BspA family leucine-rich repeat surface protein [Enterococcus casseliflavus]MEB8418522.1 BspA family leucine-rich repeat surface protein [Enterococcus casseliflavus]